MSIFHAIRSFIGLPPKRNLNQDPSQNFFIDENNPEDDDFDELYDSRSMNPNRENFGFRMFSGDVFEMHRFFEQQFDDIIKSFHSNLFQDGFSQDFGKFLPGQEEHTDAKNDDKNPRNKFLKPSYKQPALPDSSQIDKEIQDKVPPSRILDLFPDKGDAGEQKQIVEVQPRPSISRSVFKSQIIKKKILPNGGIEEERRSVSNEKDETTVTRQLDGMKHIITKSKLPDGTTETHEEFINMDEYTLADFNKAWFSHQQPQPSQSDKNSSPALPDGKHSLLDILRQFI